MAGFRKLPSGKWQASVRLPNGQRITHTDWLKKTVKEWAAEREAEIAKGNIRDPRLGQMKLGEWRERVRNARTLDKVTWRRHDSAWRVHCEPKWGNWPMASITRMEAQEWVNALTETPVKIYQGKLVSRMSEEELAMRLADEDELPTLSPNTITGIIYHLSSLYNLAMKETPPLVSYNPFSKLDRPKASPTIFEFYEHEEADKLYAALEDIGFQYRVMAEVGCNVGLRPGELYGLHKHRVDVKRQQIHVIDVRTAVGIRHWPKSKKSNRWVPVPEDTWERLQMLLSLRGDEELVFQTPSGHGLDHSWLRSQVWYPAVEAAGIRRFPPKIMRHTAASWLVLDGVPLYDVQMLLGHEHSTTTERYSHLRPGEHTRVQESWRTRGARTS